jgi:hypothetical protein
MHLSESRRGIAPFSRTYAIPPPHNSIFHTHLSILTPIYSVITDTVGTIPKFFLKFFQPMLTHDLQVNDPIDL